MDFIIRMLKGFFVGIGGIAPGASGGAIAIVAGIYNEMISSVSNIFKNFKKSFLFLLPIGIGAVVGIVIFSNIQKWLISVALIPTMFCFAGLVIGTVPAIYKKANKNGHTNKNLIPFAISLIISLVICFIEYKLDNGSMVIEGARIQLTFINIIYLLFIGAMMAGSLVIPGISGTVLLLLIGAYGLVLNSVSEVKSLIPAILKFNFTPEVWNLLFTLGFLAVGLAIGAFIFSKLMNFLIEKHYTNTHFAILGFVIGSIPALYQGFSFDLTGVIAVILLIIGIFASKFLSKYGEE